MLDEYGRATAARPVDIPLPPIQVSLVHLGTMSPNAEERMDQVSIAISGMSCGGCVAAVTRALSAVPGVTVQAVEVGSASVVLEPGIGQLSSVEAAIERAGFDVVKGRVLNVAAPEKRSAKTDA
jgi:copper chaperone